MGQMTSSDTTENGVPILQKSSFDPDVIKGVREFNEASKSGPGVHMFRFKRKKDTPRDKNDKDSDIIFLASEVTDDNNILNVSYQLWRRGVPPLQNPCFEGTSCPVAPVESENNDPYEPYYTFSNGRLVMVAVVSLLRRGYKMKQIKA